MSAVLNRGVVGRPFCEETKGYPFFIYRNGDIDFTVPMFDDFLRGRMSSLGTDLWGQNIVPEFPEQTSDLYSIYDAAKFGHWSNDSGKPRPVRGMEPANLYTDRLAAAPFDCLHFHWS